MGWTQTFEHHCTSIIVCNRAIQIEKFGYNFNLGPSPLNALLKDGPNQQVERSYLCMMKPFHPVLNSHRK